MTLRLTILACLAAAASIIAGCATLAGDPKLYPYQGPILVGTNRAPEPAW